MTTLNGAEATGNGAPETPYKESPAARVEVRFGPNPTQVMPLAWAEDLLDRFRDQYPASFGKLLSEVVLQGHNNKNRLKEPKGDG